MEADGKRNTSNVQVFVKDIGTLGSAGTSSLCFVMILILIYVVVEGYLGLGGKRTSLGQEG